MYWKILWVIRVIAGALLLLAWLGKFGGDMSQLGAAAPWLLWFLDFLPNSARGWVATIGEILAGAWLLLWYKTRLAGLLWFIIMIFAWNAIGWSLDPKLLFILIWSAIAAFLWGGDFSLEWFLKGWLGKAWSLAGWVAGGLWDVAKGAGNIAWDVVWWATDLAGKAASTATWAVKDVAWAAGNVASWAVDAAGSVAKGATDAAGWVVWWAADAVKGAGWAIWWLAGWIWDMAGWVIDKGGDMAKGVVGSIADKVDAATGWVASGIIDKVEEVAGDMIDKAEDVVEDMVDGDD